MGKVESAGVAAVKSSKRVLVLRSCNADMTSYGGFKWPESGHIEAFDWNTTVRCGNGLHGFLWGEGNGSLAYWDEGAKWLVVSVEESTIIDLGGKVKYRSGEVVFCGDSKSAAQYVSDNGGFGKRIIAGTATAGARGTATAGDAGTATAGSAGTATAGERGTATAGDAGTATAGDAGTATAGSAGTATAGERGTATAGDAGTATAGARGTATAGYAGTATAGARGTATAGSAGTATAGDAGTATAGYAGTATAGARGTATAGARGTATAGDAGTATAGYAGTATAGARGTATAGARGIVAIQFWNGKHWKTKIATIKDEDGHGDLKPNVKYRLNENGDFVEVL